MRTTPYKRGRANRTYNIEGYDVHVTSYAYNFVCEGVLVSPEGRIAPLGTGGILEILRRACNIIRRDAKAAA